MAFAYGTSITTPNGTTSIERLTQRNTVLAWTPDGTAPKEVIYSPGTSDEFSASGIFFLEFGEDSLIITSNQPVVVAGNKVKKATQLRPGDKLLKADGQTEILNMISTGTWEDGLHSIAIDNPGRSGNHLIIANGIVCGDYMMEMMPSPTDDSDDMPFLTEEDHKTTD